jgi:3-oxoacyl-[acyl-carrier-protein] synthase II
MRKRVVITGMGCISPLGNDVKTTWENLIAGKSGIAKITFFDPSKLKVKIAGEVKGFDPLNFMDAKEARRSDRFTHLAIAATHEAVKDAEIDFSKCDSFRCGVIIGSGIGGITELREQIVRHHVKGSVSPLFIPKMILNMAAGLIAIRYKLRGPNFATVSACATGNHAIGVALRLIRYGDADVLIVGGTEASVDEVAICGFENMGALSKRIDPPEKASRPFDKLRDGFVLGEGAGVFVLEELEHAIKRGAKIYAEVLGFGMSDDAFHITEPDRDGAGCAACMEFALKDAQISPQDVSYINAHGTSTPYNDKTETIGIKKVFGDYAYKIPISSTKSMIGHLLGAAAAAELIATVCSINTGIIHPTINYEVPDPDCDLDYVPNVKREHEVIYAISNSMGFGGHNSCVAIGKFKN